MTNFVQMLQYSSKSLILFVCGDDIAVCVEQNYIVCILGNINYTDTNTVLDIVKAMSFLPYSNVLFYLTLF